MKNIITKALITAITVIMLLCVAPLTESTDSDFNGITVVAQAAENKIHLNEKKINLFVGDAFKQKLINKKGKIISSKKIKWKSSNRKIATVSKKGKITAKKMGKVKITATYKGKKYKFTVTVKDIPVLAPPVTMSEEEFREKENCELCSPISENTLIIPSVDLTAAYVIGNYNQELVDNNNIICNFTEWGEDDPVIFGHNYNGLSVITNIKVGDMIFFLRNGETEKYKVTHSESGSIVMGGTNIKGSETGKLCLYESEVPTLHIFTCLTVYTGENNRWMVIAEKM